MRENKKPDYSWQDRCAAAVVQNFKETLLSGTSHFVQSPTATGKTQAANKIIIAFTSEFGSDGMSSLVVGTAKVARQHRESFVKECGAKPIGNGKQPNFNGCPMDSAYFLIPTKDKDGSAAYHLVYIGTYQSFYADARRVSKGRPSALMRGRSRLLVFDECHLGGSNEHNKSMKLIFDVFKPEAKIYISATLQTVSEELLGPMAGHIFHHSYADAYAAGLLNEVMIREVEIGGSAVIGDAAAAVNMNPDDLQELSFDRLTDLAEECQRQKVEFDADAIDRLNHDLMKGMIHLYFSEHAGEQAIFYVSSIERARQMRVHWRMAEHRFGKKFPAAALHSKMDESAGDKIVDEFRAGKITALFVVGMLQEGFKIQMSAHEETRPKMIVKEPLAVKAEWAEEIVRLKTDKRFSDDEIAVSLSQRFEVAFDRNMLPEIILGKHADRTFKERADLLNSMGFQTSEGLPWTSDLALAFLFDQEFRRARIGGASIFGFFD